MRTLGEKLKKPPSIIYMQQRRAQSRKRLLPTCRSGTNGENTNENEEQSHHCYTTAVVVSDVYY